MSTTIYRAGWSIICDILLCFPFEVLVTNWATEYLVDQTSPTASWTLLYDLTKHHEWVATSFCIEGQILSLTDMDMVKWLKSVECGQLLVSKIDLFSMLTVAVSCQLEEEKWVVDHRARKWPSHPRNMTTWPTRPWAPNPAPSVKAAQVTIWTTEVETRDSR